MLGKRKRVVPYGGGNKRTKSVVSKIPRPRFKLLAKHQSKVQTSLKAVLTYSEPGVGLNPGAGLAATYVFAANGLFDPNITGVGHQPTGFDQLMGLYNEYVVIGSTIKVVFSNIDNANPQTVGIALLDFNATSADIRNYIENGYCTWTTLSQRGGGKDTATLTLKADISKFSSQDVLTEDGFSGISTSNPDDTHFFHLFAVAADNSTDTGLVTAGVEINYDCVFRDNSFTALS